MKSLKGSWIVVYNGLSFKSICESSFFVLIVPAYCEYDPRSYHVICKWVGQCCKGLVYHNNRKYIKIDTFIEL